MVKFGLSWHLDPTLSWLTLVGLFLWSFWTDLHRCGVISVTDAQLYESISLTSSCLWDKVSQMNFHDLQGCISLGDIASLESKYASYQSYYRTKFLLLRGISVVYIVAFTSLAAQSTGIYSVLFPISKSLGNVRKVLDLQANLSPSMKTASLNGVNFESIRRNWINRSILSMTSLIMSPASAYPSYTTFVCKICSYIALAGVFYPHWSIFCVLYINYMAFKKLSGPFLNFAWDALLLESGILAILLSFSYANESVITYIWLFRLLLFRLMFGSGLVKWFSKDKSWNVSFTAMSYHFLTQPLPKPIASIFHHLPEIVLKMVTISTLVIECLFPLISLIPSFETAAFVSYSMLQGSIMVAGNYGYFNMLSIVLGISLLPDTMVASLLPPINVGSDGIVIFSFLPVSMNLQLVQLSNIYRNYLTNIKAIISSASEVFNVEIVQDVSKYLKDLGDAYGLRLLLIIAIGFYLVYFEALYILIEKVLINTQSMKSPKNNEISMDSPSVSPASSGRIVSDEGSNGEDKPASSSLSPTNVKRSMMKSIHEYCSPLYLGSHYGLFGTMTKRRFELIIFLSKDGKSGWYPIEFAYKPGIPSQIPRDMIPLFHMPRLDWLMWFVALRPSPETWPEWFWNLIIGLLQNDPLVLNLLDKKWNRWLSSSNKSSTPSDISYKYIKVELFDYTFASPFTQLNTNENVSPTASSIATKKVEGNDERKLSPKSVTAQDPSKDSDDIEPYKKQKKSGDDLSSNDVKDATEQSNTEGNSDDSKAKNLKIDTAQSTTATEAAPKRKKNMRRMYWTIKPMEELLPPMTLQQVMIYRDKIKNSRRYKDKSVFTFDGMSTNTSPSSSGSAKTFKSPALTEEEAADIIKRFAHYSNNSMLDGKSIGQEHRNRPIRSPIQRSPSNKAAVAAGKRIKMESLPIEDKTTAGDKIRTEIEDISSESEGK